MTGTTKIAVAVASGYLLGRSRRLKLAIAVGSMMAGKRLAADPQALLKQGTKLIDASPELRAMQDQIRGRLMEAAKAAAITAATSRLDNLNQSLLESGGRAKDRIGDDVEESRPAGDRAANGAGDEEENAGEEPPDDDTMHAARSRRAKKKSVSEAAGEKASRASSGSRKRSTTRKSATKRQSRNGGER